MTSAMFAFARCETLGMKFSAQTNRTRRSFMAALEEIDRRYRPLSRNWVPLNALRRTQRDLLNPAEQEAAWWFTARSDCDGLLTALASLEGLSEPFRDHLRSCAECTSDLAKAKT